MFTKELLAMFGSSADLEALGLTSLHAAILGIGTDSIKEALLNTTRAAVDQIDSIGMTALAWATTRSDIFTMRALLRKGADPNLPDSQGRTTLHHWVKGGNHDCLRILLESGAQPNRPDKFGETPFLRAMYFFKNVRVHSLDLLIAHGADPSQKTLDGWTSLHLTVRWNWTDILRLDCLLGHGLNINEMDEDGMTPVMIATVHNLSTAVEDLLERGASYLGRMQDGRSLLHVIAAYADIATMRVFHQHCLIKLMDFDALDHAGQTAIEIAKMRAAQTVYPQPDPESPEEDWYASFMALLDSADDEEFFDTVPNIT